jgi:hypothetical protein
VAELHVGGHGTPPSGNTEARGDPTQP